MTRVRERSQGEIGLAWRNQGSGLHSKQGGGILIIEEKVTRSCPRRGYTKGKTNVDLAGLQICGKEGH